MNVLELHLINTNLTWKRQISDDIIYISLASWKIIHNLGIIIRIIIQDRG